MATAVCGSAYRAAPDQFRGCAEIRHVLGQSPFQGYLIDLFGPRTLLSIGAILSAASWVLAATVKTTLGLYFTYGLLGGIGTGIIYVGVVGLMVGWFPDRRGLACGIVAVMGWGLSLPRSQFRGAWLRSARNQR
jgi:MFS family permease